jgi:hypothetical protein
MELLSGHEKIITKSRISLNAGTLNRSFTVCVKTLELKNVMSVSYTDTTIFTELSTVIISHILIIL